MWSLSLSKALTMEANHWSEMPGVFWKICLSAAIIQLYIALPQPNFGQLWFAPLGSSFLKVPFIGKRCSKRPMTKHPKWEFWSFVPPHARSRHECNALYFAKAPARGANASRTPGSVQCEGWENSVKWMTGQLCSAGKKSLEMEGDDETGLRWDCLDSGSPLGTLVCLQAIGPLERGSGRQGRG